MRFSVLLTTYYKETPENLDAALCSITDNQTVLPDQIVIVLDGPVQNELNQIVNKYMDKYPTIFQLVKLSNNVGQGEASAQGIKYCKYDYIARMDSDDISMPTRFESQMAIFNSEPEVSVVGGYIGEFVDITSNVQRIREVPQQHKNICKMFKFRSPINNVTAMFKKEALERAGGYKKERANEDFSIYVRMLCSGSLFYNIPEVLVKVRVGTDMLNRRGDIHIFLAWCKNQKILLKGKKTNLLSFWVSCLACLIFIIIPPRVKQFLYNTYLRRQTSF